MNSTFIFKHHKYYTGVFGAPKVKPSEPLKHVYFNIKIKSNYYLGYS